MIISVDISYYPLQEEYLAPIKDFIQRLQSHVDLRVQCNRMSTQVFGEYAQVMQVLTQEIEKSFHIPHSVFVLKIINSDRTPNS